MKIKQLQWDSDFFNKKIGELSLNEAVKFPFDLTQDYDLIIIKKRFYPIYRLGENCFK